MQIVYSPNNTKIINSYLLSTRKAIKEEVEWIKENRIARNYKVSRTTNSYVREWLGHNRLYRMGLFRSHTKDVDLQEPSSLLNELIWLILGW